MEYSLPPLSQFGFPSPSSRHPPLLAHTLSLSITYFISEIQRLFKAIHRSRGYNIQCGSLLYNLNYTLYTVDIILPQHMGTSWLYALLTCGQRANVVDYLEKHCFLNLFISSHTLEFVGIFTYDVICIQLQSRWKKTCNIVGFVLSWLNLFINGNVRIQRPSMVQLYIRNHHTNTYFPK